jgi:hypothetical protein
MHQPGDLDVHGVLSQRGTRSSAQGRVGLDERKQAKRTGSGSTRA